MLVCLSFSIDMILLSFYLPQLQDYVVNVFDAVLVTSYALHRYLADGHVLTAPRFDEDTCTRGQLEPWSEGELFTEYLTNVGIIVISQLLRQRDSCL